MGAACSRCEDPAAPCHLLGRKRLNVSLDLEHSNAALRRTQDAMHGILRVTGLSELGHVLERLRGCPVDKAERSLDLIAHANSDGVLLFGTSLVAAGDRELAAFAREHGRALRALGVTRVRLLGCYTGAGGPGRKALRHVRDALDLDVYGWGEFLDESYFDVDGLSPKWDGFTVRA